MPDTPRFWLTCDEKVRAIHTLNLAHDVSYAECAAAHARICSKGQGCPYVNEGASPDWGLEYAKVMQNLRFALANRRARPDVTEYWQTWVDGGIDHAPVHPLEKCEL